MSRDDEIQTSTQHSHNVNDDINNLNTQNVEKNRPLPPTPTTPQFKYLKNNYDDNKVGDDDYDRTDKTQILKKTNEQNIETNDEEEEDADVTAKEEENLDLQKIWENHTKPKERVRGLFIQRHPITCAPKTPTKRYKIRGWSNTAKEVALVTKSLKKYGILPTTHDNFWDFMWTLRVTREEFRILSNFQKVNYIPGLQFICRKDLLNKQMNKLRKHISNVIKELESTLDGDQYNEDLADQISWLEYYGSCSFWPISFNLEISEEFQLFLSCFPQSKQQNNHHHNMITSSISEQFTDLPTSFHDDEGDEYNKLIDSMEEEILNSKTGIDVDHDNCDDKTKINKMKKKKKNGNVGDDDDDDGQKSKKRKKKLKKEENFEIENEEKEEEDDIPTVFIVKKPFSSCGKGVHLVTSRDDVLNLLEESSSCYPIEKHRPLAQIYLSDVQLYDGFKFTLRIYVAITSVNPLKAFVFNNGLLRICSRRYSKENFMDQFAHIDSIDLNVLNKSEVHEFSRGVIHDGLRLDLLTYFEILRNDGINTEKIWQEMCDVIALGLIAGEGDYTKITLSTINQRSHAFDLLGYDILLDSNFKPYILEINHTPSLTPHTNLENEVKESMLTDLFKLVDITGQRKEMINRIYNEKYQIIRKLKELSDSDLDRYYQQNPKLVPFDLLSFTIHDIYVIVETELEMKDRGGYDRILPSCKFHPIMLQNRNVLIANWVKNKMSFNDIRPISFSPSPPSSPSLPR